MSNCTTFGATGGSNSEGWKQLGFCQIMSAFDATIIRGRTLWGQVSATLGSSLPQFLSTADNSGAATNERCRAHSPQALRPAVHRQSKTTKRRENRMLVASADLAQLASADLQ